MCGGGGKREEKSPIHRPAVLVEKLVARLLERQIRPEHLFGQAFARQRVGFGPPQMVEDRGSFVRVPGSGLNRTVGSSQKGIQGKRVGGLLVGG